MLLVCAYILPGWTFEFKLNWYDTNIIADVFSSGRCFICSLLQLMS